MARDPELTIVLSSGATLDSATGSAEMDAPDVGSDWMGVALEKMGAGGITQTALVYSDAERSVRAFGDAYPSNVGITVTISGECCDHDSCPCGRYAPRCCRLGMGWGELVLMPPMLSTAAARVAPSLYGIPITLDAGLSTSGVTAARDWNVR